VNYRIVNYRIECHDSALHRPGVWRPLLGATFSTEAAAEREAERMRNTATYPRKVKFRVAEAKADGRSAT
jgi:hypothetical protein